MRQSVTMRFDPEVLMAAKRKAVDDHRTLTNYIEMLVRRDLQLNVAEPALEVIAPADIRNSSAVPVPDETEDERKRRDDVFFAVLDAVGY